MDKIIGIVVEGKKLGRKLGFPTANVNLQEKLEGGVYRGIVVMDGGRHKAAVFVWPDKMLLEAHLLDFAGDMYGKEIEVEILEKVRDSIKFDSEKILIKQIAKDIELIRTHPVRADEAKI